MIVLDASVWVSLLVADDANHPDSKQWIAGRLERQEAFVVPALFTVEVAGAVRRRSGSIEDAMRSIARLQRDPYFVVLDLDRDFSAMAAETAARLALRGADAVYVALARRLSLPLVTWDNEQRERSAGVIEALTPVEALARLP
jgi:predicted nucleic acid-binding protein